MKKNDTAVVKIEDIGINGEGIGKADGYTLFIKDTVMGDLVEVKVMKAKKNYGYAKLLRVIEPSKNRVEAKCPVAKQCGGCQIQEMDYQEQLRISAEKAATADASKTDFLRRISHDIRTPINGIRGMTEIGLECVKEPSRVKDCFEKIYTASDFLLELVNNILDMSKMEAGEMESKNESFNLKEILDNAAAMLKPGGRLVYSTCTFAPVENEGSISWILEQCPEMELIPIEGYEGFSEGNPAWGDGREELRRCVRIWPHKMKGEGHFLALLKKSEDAPETRIRLEPPTRMDKKNKAVLEEFFRDCQWKPDWERVQIKGEKVYLVPELPAKLNGIHFLRNGLYLGDLKKNRFEPSQQLAMTLKASDYEGSVSLSPEDERIGRYLRGETLLLEPGEATREKGWILVCVDQYALGWGKLVNGVLKNKYWSGWRLKS